MEKRMKLSLYPFLNAYLRRVVLYIISLFSLNWLTKLFIVYFMECMLFNIYFISDPERFTESDDDNAFEEVNIQTWLNKPGVIGQFECAEIKDSQTRCPGCVFNL